MGKCKFESSRNSDVKDVCLIALPYQRVSLPPQMCNNFDEDFVSSSKIAERIKNVMRKKFNQYRNFNDNNHDDARGLSALIYDSDPSQLLQCSKCMGMAGWEAHTVSDSQELVDVNVGNYHLVVIDNYANQRSIDEDGIDIAECIRFKGYTLAIVALKSSLHQKESSIYFTGSVVRPLIGSAKFKEMTIDVFYEVLLSVDTKNFERNKQL